MDTTMWFITYLVIINLIGFTAMGVDKRRARLDRWRIPEKRLWSIAIIGGAVGVWIGMRGFRHKTKHNTFIYGIPAVFLIQISIYLVIKARLLS